MSPTKPFTHLSLSTEMLENLNSLSYTEMTPIQELTIPVILKGKDLMAQAKTGSGKTAAFGIGILERLDISSFSTQCLVLCPTRELSEQVAGEIRRIARFRDNIKVQSITGGVQMRRQEQSLKHPAHIIVGTPGRILKLLERESIESERITCFILDEADRMLDMGFEDQILGIIRYLPEQRQTLCFSATFPEEIRKLGQKLLQNPREITTEAFHRPDAIEQHFLEAIPKDKPAVLIGILAHYAPESVVIFCNTKESCRKLGAMLEEKNLHSLALHGDLEQWERTEVLIRFANNSSRILVATDVAARGLDIDSLGAVVNYDLPFDTEIYVHRIGRTGRAGKEGLAFSLVRPRESFRLEAINEYLSASFALETPGPELAREDAEMDPPMITLSIAAGRRDKVSAGDILGALTSEGGLEGADVGKIDRLERLTYCAVQRETGKKALQTVRKGKIKGRQFKAELLDN